MAILDGRDKIAETEVRGMHVLFHDEFKALPEAAIARRLAAFNQRSST